MLAAILFASAWQLVVDTASLDAAGALNAAGVGAVTTSARAGDTIYAALADGGVAVVDVSDPAHPVVTARLLAGRAVSRLVVDGDALIAVVLDEQALTFSLANPTAPVAALPRASAVARPASPPTPAVASTTAVTRSSPAKLRAHVVDVKEGRVIIDAGGDDGVEKAMHVRVVAQRLVAKPDLTSAHGGTREVASGEVTAVVAIEEVDAHRSMAALGRGDVAEPGDVVEATSDDLSERLFLPRRAPFSLRTGFMARPFLGLDSVRSYPVGILVDAYASWYFSSIPLALTAEIAPAGFSVFSNDLHYPITLVAGASYVTDYFEVGAGAGGLVGNAGPCIVTYLPDPKTGLPVAGTPTCEVNTGFTFNQLLRLGPVDGIHLAWESSVFARPTGFVLGVGRGEIAVPVSSRLGLFSGGGVGENGWAYGELGVRNFFGGTGGPGTVMLSASLGVAGIFDGAGKPPTYQREAVVGPTVAFGAEWRL